MLTLLSGSFVRLFVFFTVPYLLGCFPKKCNHCSEFKSIGRIFTFLSACIQLKPKESIIKKKKKVTLLSLCRVYIN